MNAAEQAAERVRRSRELAAENTAAVMRLAARTGLSVRRGLSMTGLLSCASHSVHDEWMHWMLKHQGQNFKRFGKSSTGTLTEEEIAQSMHSFEEEKYEVEAAAHDDDPTTRPGKSEVPRQRVLEQALKFRADSELDRMLLSAWQGPVDGALHLLGNLPATAGDGEESMLASPIFANPRGLSAVRTTPLSRKSEQRLARLAQPPGHRMHGSTNLDEQFQAADARPRTPLPIPEHLMEQVRAGNLTMAEYKAALKEYESRQRRHSPCLVVSSPAGGSPTPKSRRPRSAAPGRDRFDRELEVVAAACWAGDELAGREYTRGLSALGMARVVRRVKDETVAGLLSDGKDSQQNEEEQPGVHQEHQASPPEEHRRADLKAAIGTRTTLLHIAAAKGHASVVAALLGPPDRDGRPSPDGLAHVNAENGQRCTALIAAVMASSSVSANQLHEVVSALILAGADVNAVGSCGVSALQVAAADGHVAVVQSLLAAGAAVNATWDGGATALLLAAQHGHLDVCKALILAGADVMCSDVDGLTPLMAAAMSGHEPVAEELLRHAVEKVAARTGRVAPTKK